MAEETKKKAAPKKEAKPEATAAAEEKPAAKPAKKAAPAGETADAAPKTAEAPAVPAAGVAPTAAELLTDDPNAKKIIKAKGAKNISTGIANILATFNNTQVSITDLHGNLLG